VDTRALPEADSGQVAVRRRKEVGSMDNVFAAGKYISWGVVSISLTNFLVIVAMVVVFVLALVLPFPHEHESPADGGDA
jgi:hypothetical protein